MLDPDKLRAIADSAMLHLVLFLVLASLSVAGCAGTRLEATATQVVTPPSISPPILPTSTSTPHPPTMTPSLPPTATSTPTTPPLICSVPLYETGYPSTYSITGLEYAHLPAYDRSVLLGSVETANLPVDVASIPDGMILVIDAQTLELLDQYVVHPSTAPSGITYDSVRNRIVTAGSLGGPRDQPWDAGTDYFFVHDPQDLSVTAVFPAPPGMGNVCYREASDTYFGVIHGGEHTLVEFAPDDFSVIHRYPLPMDIVNQVKTLAIIEADTEEPLFFVGYSHRSSGDATFDLFQVLRQTDGTLETVDAVRVPGEYRGAPAIVWIAEQCTFITYGNPWFSPEGLPPGAEGGTFFHNDICNPIPDMIRIAQMASGCGR
jgi:hypothetical protein